MSIPDYDLDKASKRIRLWQRETGLKGKEVAQMAGISASYYSNILGAKKRGSVGVLARIAGVFDRKLDDLLEQKSHSPPKAGKAYVKNIQPINTPELQKMLKPILGKDTDDFVDCYMVWRRAPKHLKKALKSFDVLRKEMGRASMDLG